MLIINFSEELKELDHYIRYLDVERELKVRSPSADDLVDLIYNNPEKRICYCFECDKYNAIELSDVIGKINPDIYQNLEKTIVFISKTPFDRLPPNNNLPCFLITNILNDNTVDGKEKYLDRKSVV